ncbi:MAG: hypothetical protein ACJAVI_003390 [Candidatus Azotimanducaceae bacterium]
MAFPEKAIYGTVPDEMLWSLGSFVGPAISVFTLVGIVFFFFIELTA